MTTAPSHTRHASAVDALFDLFTTSMSELTRQTVTATLKQAVLPRRRDRRAAAHDIPVRQAATTTYTEQPSTPYTASIMVGDDAYTVILDIRPCDKDTVTLEYAAGALKVSGVHRSGTTKREHIQPLEDVLALPNADVVVDDATAAYNNGVVTVRLPRRAAAPDTDDART